MQPTERAAYQLFFAGIPYRVGIGRKFYEVITFMHSVSRNKFIPLRHEADYCMDMARKIGVTTNNIKLEIFLSDEERKEAKDFFAKRDVSESDLKVFFHFGSLGSAPHWNEEKYFSLVQKFCSTFSDKPYKIILTAKEMSPEFRLKIAQLYNTRIHDISNELYDLRDLIKYTSQADLFFAPQIHGILNDRSIHLEVSEEYCNKNCSADKEKCAIQTGLSEEDVLEAFQKLLLIK